MIRKISMIVALVAAGSLAGCATYGQQAYQNGRGDYYYGYPSGSSSMSVSIGSGGYYYPGRYYGGYGYPSYGYGGYYGGYGYPGYYNGYPYYGNPRYNHPRPRPRPDSNAGPRGPQQQPGWRDLDSIRNQNAPRPDTRAQVYERPVRVESRPQPVRSEARAEARQESRSSRNTYERARSESRRTQPIEP